MPINPTVYSLAAQIVSGALFGVTSLYYYGEKPDQSAMPRRCSQFNVAAALVGVLLAAV